MAKNFAFARGDTVYLDLQVTLEGASEDLTGATLFFTAKDQLTDFDTAAQIRKSSGGVGGIAIVSATEGTARVTISPGDTAALLPIDNHFHYDVQLKRANGDVFSVADGGLLVYPDVTISTT